MTYTIIFYAPNQTITKNGCTEVVEEENCKRINFKDATGKSCSCTLSYLLSEN